MSNKDFTVLSECVDSRSGRRFHPGDTFSPPPTIDQVQRLVAAGCLPQTALQAVGVDASVAAINNQAAGAISAARATADAEITRINAGVSDARQKADAEIKEIDRQLTDARQKAQNTLDDLNGEIATAQSALTKAGDDLKTKQAELDDVDGKVLTATASLADLDAAITKAKSETKSK